jgi:AraC-like DNA-binding protein
MRAGRDRMTVLLDYRVPSEDLRPYVTLFYHFRADVPVFDDVERADHAQWRFRLSPGAARYHFADGGEQTALPCHVIGPTSTAFRTVAQGPVEVIGMGLQPAGWAALLGVDASTLLDRSIDAAGIMGGASAAARAGGMLRAAAGTDAKIMVLEPLVRRALAAGDRGALAFARAIDGWLAARRSPAVEDLVALADLSRRQVERRTKALYGVPPKTLARKYRALRAAVALAEGAPMGETLEQGGFYDQSHLIRELKQFTGLTPRQLRDTPTLLSQLTMRQRRALEGRVHPIISDT